MPQAGRTAGRPSYGTTIRATINGVTRTFPGALQGLAESAPGAAAAGAEQRVRFPDGTFKPQPSGAAQQREQKRLTLSCELVPYLLDYRAIAALAGSETQMEIQQHRAELPIAGVTASGNTVAISTAFVPTFSGTSHPSSVPIKGAALQVAGKNFVMPNNTVPSNAGANVNLDSGLHLLDVDLDRQGVTSASVYKSGAAATLAAAVDAAVYSVVHPETLTATVAVKVLSAPRWASFQGGEPGTSVGGDIVFEVVSGDLPFEQVQDLPVVT